jgi:MOSC N-terminal beta barrel domain
MEAVMTVAGRVAALWRYPVKSMAGEELEAVEVSWNGLAGDRRWAFIRDGQVRSGFPWLTIREQPELAHYRPRFAEPDRPNASLTLVTIDPVTLRRNPAVLRAIARERDAQLGVYGSTVEPGRVAVGVARAQLPAAH